MIALISQPQLVNDNKYSTQLVKKKALEETKITSPTNLEKIQLIKEQRQRTRQQNLHYQVKCGVPATQGPILKGTFTEYFFHWFGSLRWWDTT